LKQDQRRPKGPCGSGRTFIYFFTFRHNAYSLDQIKSTGDLSFLVRLIQLERGHIIYIVQLVRSLELAIATLCSLEIECFKERLKADVERNRIILMRSA